MYYSVGADIGAIDFLLASRSCADASVVFSELKLGDQERFDQVRSLLEGKVIPAVGSGAWRLSADFKSRFRVLLEKHREPICVWTAIQYVLSDQVDPLEAYKFVHSDSQDARYPISAPFPCRETLMRSVRSVSFADLVNSFPILLVNVKTGTSFYRIDSPTEFLRVGGSSIGASTIHALGKSLASARSMAQLSQRASCLSTASRADLLVEDIYGGDCSSIGLPGSIIASSLGKATSELSESPDLAKSLIDLMCINTAQLAKLHAELNGCALVVIVGAIGSLEEQLEISECIQRVLNILTSTSSTPLTAVFFSQAKYLGCLGALLRRESLVKGLRGKDYTPIDTATLNDGVDEETYTKLRVSTPPPRRTPGEYHCS